MLEHGAQDLLTLVPTLPEWDMAFEDSLQLLSLVCEAAVDLDALLPSCLQLFSGLLSSFS